MFTVMLACCLIALFVLLAILSEREKYYFLAWTAATADVSEKLEHSELVDNDQAEQAARSSSRSSQISPKASDTKSDLNDTQLVRKSDTVASKNRDQ